MPDSVPASLRIGLASAPNAPTVAARLDAIDRCLTEAAARDVAITCFPEAYIPGLRGQDFPVPPADQARQEAALACIQGTCARTGVAAIVGMEWQGERGLHNIAAVIDRDGTLLGHQAKNQVAPEEYPFYVAEGGRRLFTVDGVPFGIVICHEGWRYPEAVRWVARRGAKVVFHPQLTGSDRHGEVPARWCDPDAPYYERALVCRAIENTVYVASVNTGLRYQESATCVVGPGGDLVASLPYGEAGLLVVDLELARATGTYAHRLDPRLAPIE